MVQGLALSPHMILISSMASHQTFTLICVDRWMDGLKTKKEKKNIAKPCVLCCNLDHTDWIQDLIKTEYWDPVQTKDVHIKEQSQQNRTNDQHLFLQFAFTSMERQYFLLERYILIILLNCFYFARYFEPFCFSTALNQKKPQWVCPVPDWDLAR